MSQHANAITPLEKAAVSYQTFWWYQKALDSDLHMNYRWCKLATRRASSTPFCDCIQLQACSSATTDSYIHATRRNGSPNTHYTLPLTPHSHGHAYPTPPLSLAVVTRRHGLLCCSILLLRVTFPFPIQF